MEQVQLALDSSQTTPDVIYLTGGSARSPLIKKAAENHLRPAGQPGGYRAKIIATGQRNTGQPGRQRPPPALPRSRSVLIVALQITLEYSWSPTQNGLFFRISITPPCGMERLLTADDWLRYG
jgi:hypothetical protein